MLPYYVQRQQIYFSMNGKRLADERREKTLEQRTCGVRRKVFAVSERRYCAHDEREGP